MQLFHGTISEPIQKQSKCRRKVDDFMKFLKQHKKGAFIIGFVLMLAVLALLVASDVHTKNAADPTGISYAAVQGSQTLQKVASTANKALFGANYVWIMICAFMVFFFQCGFAMVETGFCRAKNAAHTMTMNFMVFLVGAVGYFLVGFALQMGMRPSEAVEPF